MSSDRRAFLVAAFGGVLGVLGLRKVLLVSYAEFEPVMAFKGADVFTIAGHYAPTGKLQEFIAR